ncbi:MAG: hypothetical protein ACC656_12365 [Candidatus Heimdallarchaeota archaeon]
MNKKLYDCDIIADIPIQQATKFEIDKYYFQAGGLYSGGKYIQIKNKIRNIDRFLVKIIEPLYRDAEKTQLVRYKLGGELINGIDALNWFEIDYDMWQKNTTI